MKNILEYVSSLLDKDENLLFYSPKTVLIATMENLGKLGTNKKRKRKRPVKGSTIITERRLVIMKIRGSKVSESKRYELLIDPDYAASEIQSINKMIADAKDGKETTIPKRKLRRMHLYLLAGINLKDNILGKRIRLNVYTIIFNKRELKAANLTHKALKVLSFGLGSLKEMTYTLTFKKPLTMGDAARKVLMLMLPAGQFLETLRSRGENKANAAYEESVNLLKSKADKIDAEKAKLQELVNLTGSI
jgi:hypothetical protein